MAAVIWGVLASAFCHGEFGIASANPAPACGVAIRTAATFEGAVAGVVAEADVGTCPVGCAAVTRPSAGCCAGAVLLANASCSCSPTVAAIAAVAEVAALEFVANIASVLGPAVCSATFEDAVEGFAIAKMLTCPAACCVAASTDIASVFRMSFDLAALFRI